MCMRSAVVMESRNFRVGRTFGEFASLKGGVLKGPSGR